MNFALFVLLNAVLLLRPEELFPDLAGLRLYLIVIVLCTAISLPRLLELLSPSSLQQRPVALCILLYFIAMIVSLCVWGRFDEAFFEFGPEFAKVVLYYFLFIAVVDSAFRFRMYVASLVVLIVGLTAIAIAQHNGLAHFDNIVPSMQRDIDPVTGEEFSFPRLVSTGVFNDPNDLCLILGLGIFCCIYCSTTSSLGIFGRLTWLIPIPLFIYAITETYSRGGLMAVLAGVVAYLYSRFGGPRSLPLAIAGVVVALAVIGGRQGNIAGGGTAHERLMLWSDGLTELFRKPLFVPTGLGTGWFIEETGHVAHNSFIEAYVETGLFGGGVFLAAFYLSARLIHRLGTGVDAPRWVVDARHFAFAAVVGYAMGCYSLTRNYVIPTYLTLGIASALLEQAAPRLPEKFRVSARWFRWLALFAICGLVLLKVSTQGLGKAGI